MLLFNCLWDLLASEWNCFFNIFRRKSQMFFVVKDTWYKVKSIILLPFIKTESGGVDVVVSVLLLETGRIGLAWFRSVNILPS